MSFLKKLGSVVLKIIGLWTGFSPLLTNIIPSSGQKVLGEVSQAFGIVGTVEQMFTAAYGPDHKLPSEKLTAAAPFIGQLIQSTDLLAGKKPRDEKQFVSGVQDFTSALVKILNSYGE